jgi:pyroglutamyl-peptidase
VCILENSITNETTTTTNTTAAEEEESTYEWGECLKTTLDVSSLCSVLQKESNDDNNDENGGGVIVSTDPGRFVCNYTYCLSLDRCHSTNKKHYCRGENGTMKHCGEIMQQQQQQQYHTLFIHVPPFSVISESKQLEFVYKVMYAIEKQVSI